MIKRFGNATDPLQTLCVAGVSRLAPLAIADPQKRKALHELANSPEGLRQALVLGQYGEWDLVAKCLTEFVESNPDDLQGRGWHLLSLLESGDVPGHRFAAEKILSRFRKSSDPNSLNIVAWWCCYAPDTVTDLTAPVQMAETAVGGYPAEQKRFALNTLGAALYRAGRIDEAIARLDESVKASEGNGVPEDWVFLAMAHHKKGHGEEARRWLEKVRAHVHDEKTAFSSNLVEVRILFREAELLLRRPSSAQP
jgi:tetratricopeptide (TPR) repeat protein